jgi:hypothetical protein
MNILYVSRKDENGFIHIDYLDECLLTGLKELYGNQVVDINKKLSLYTDYPDELKHRVYGRGYTITQNIEPHECDRDDIENKIKNNFYDYVVYAKIENCQDYFDLVNEYYPKNRIALLDGGDWMNIHPSITHNTMFFKRECFLGLSNVKYSRYFSNIKPISFAYPTKRISRNTNKSKLLSIINPLDRSTYFEKDNPSEYIFKSEEEYYNEYQTSSFAITCQKAGWDCLRHYEIMGNGCIPLFHRIESAPPGTISSLPRRLLLQIRTLWESNQDYLINNYEEYSERLFEHFIQHNTTIKLAEYFIKEMEEAQK